MKRPGVTRGALRRPQVEALPAEAPWAGSLNPARGVLFIARRPQNVYQTPSGVTCRPWPLHCHSQRAYRSPLTGFGSVIGDAGYYKQHTPSGVVVYHSNKSEDVCRVQVFPRYRRQVILRSGGMPRTPNASRASGGDGRYLSFSQVGRAELVLLRLRYGGTNRQALFHSLQ
jgi:hypothetical protein